MFIAPRGEGNYAHSCTLYVSLYLYIHRGSLIFSLVETLEAWENGQKMCSRQSFDLPKGSLHCAWCTYVGEVCCHSLDAAHASGHMTYDLIKWGGHTNGGAVAQSKKCHRVSGGRGEWRGRGWKGKNLERERERVNGCQNLFHLKEYVTFGALTA